MTAPLELRFVVEGKPVPYQRPGWEPKRRIRFTEPESERYQTLIRAEARAAAMRELVNGRYVPRSPRWPSPDDCIREAYRRRGAKSPKCVCAWCDRYYAIELLIVLPDYRTRDIDNIGKAILDGCKHALYRDDGKSFVVPRPPLINPDRPRVEAVVRAIPRWAREGEVAAPQLELTEKTA